MIFMKIKKKQTPDREDVNTLARMTHNIPKNWFPTNDDSIVY
jgi:hypothetical protein